MWLWAVIGFVAGVVVGVAATALRRRGSESEQRFRRLRREFDQYQGDVAHHFSQTAEALTRLRGGFEQLYQEVEGSAGHLVGEESWQRRLRQLEPNGSLTPPTSVPAHDPGTDEGVAGAARPPVGRASGHLDAVQDAVPGDEARPEGGPER